MRFPRRIKALPLFAVVTLLAGCVNGPLPRLSPPIPAQWQHAVDSASPPTDLRGWWKTFNDPQLDALVDAALRDNLDVAQATERLRAARTLRGSSNAQFRPNLSAKTEDAIDPDASASFLVVGFDSVWELGLWGRPEAARRQSQGHLDEVSADLQMTRVSLVGEVVRDWLRLRANQQKLQTLQAIRDARQQQLDLLRIRQRLQLGSAASVDQAQAILAQAEGALAEPRMAIEANARRLAVLLGRNRPDPRWLKAGDTPELGAWRLTSTPADLLRTRPEIARAQADVLRAAGDLGLARAEKLPNIGIGGSLVWSTNLTTHRRTNDNGLVTAGPLIDIPLFDWGLREAQERAKKHELRAAVLAYRQAVLVGVSEVETALGNLEQQRQRERQTGIAAQALARAEAATARRVKLQLESPLEQIDTALAHDQAVLEQVDARTARGLAFVALYKALGGAPLQDVTADDNPKDAR